MTTPRTATHSAKTDTSETAKTFAGLAVPRLLSESGSAALESVIWEERTASITSDKGETIFEQKGVQVPQEWSALAGNIVASKYFYGDIGGGERENSVGQLVHRVSRTIADWGHKDGYFASGDDAETFYQELCAICVGQYASFNSPVWFNVGLNQAYGTTSTDTAAHRWSRPDDKIIPAEDSYATPQVSACFIQSVSDSIESIMKLATSEALLFKYGSGSGTDLSAVRSARELLSGGGTASGPLSFMRVYDQVASVIKSGGKTRRAAKMQSLKVDHPDIMEFISCKRDEEKKAHALIAQGYDGSFCGDAYSSVMFQNANLSVRVSDAFMKSVLNDEPWSTREVCTGAVSETHKARQVMQTIAECAHACGDPGLQYDTTINRWHTCAATDRINASNPCSEYMFLDDSACNLASINLTRFLKEDGELETDRLRHVARLVFIAQEILVDNASYPTGPIALNSHRYRPLGLGYANLGALLMKLGLSYDSDKGRGTAAAITALLTGQAYLTSAEMAGVMGPFEGYAENRASMQNVIRMHHAAVSDIHAQSCPKALLSECRDIWSRVETEGEKTGFRNAQATVLAPTGTIAFMMDCDTTGVEPDIALVKYKQMAGGGLLKIVNASVPDGLRALGYPETHVDEIVTHIQEKDTIEGAPHLKPEHLPVFDCAFKPANGERFLPYSAHLKMMSAVQPYISGAISKTVNMPSDATADDIAQVYIEGWKMGLKAVAVYRDGSKGTQPLSTANDTAEVAPDQPSSRPYRRRMPDTRQSLTHKFEIAGHEGYLTVGLYPDGRPGELFITMAKEGSTVGGIMDAFGTAISMCLQYGVSLNVLVRKFAHMRFEPSGFTKCAEIPMAKSLIDYIFRWLEITFPNGAIDGAHSADNGKTHEPIGAPAIPVTLDSQFRHFMEDAPACDQCGSITVRNGSCYRCHNCGNSMGCS
ncbi:MAG: vitamin B12-dependent ribonucleotide reductase [Verrucomicrobia bacterium]|nr:vitamin B12-dependent ribonucleotide reductase [Verrucomicrobiota bacterium]MDA1086566.1 vitamin B12-dependent ribonucleotide reductase [Verrucomicrobiota bacterium]